MGVRHDLVTYIGRDGENSSDFVKNGRMMFALEQSGRQR